MAGAVMVAAAFLYNRGGKEAGDSMTLQALSKEFTEMKKEFKAFSDTLQQIAVQETKIELLMKWYDELRHGEGFIQAPRRANIDGEYKR
jgi:hypothetical protein